MVPHASVRFHGQNVHVIVGSGALLNQRQPGSRVSVRENDSLAANFDHSSII